MERPGSSWGIAAAILRPVARGLRLLIPIGALAGCATTSSAVTPAPSNPIVQAGHPTLRARAAEVSPEQLGPPAFEQLIARMVAAMRGAPGVGLAAPQLGEGLRIFVIEDPEQLSASLTPAERAERERVPVPLKVFINPVVTPIGPDKATFFEGCLSVSGFAALVERSLEVEVSALDEKGRPFTWRTRGWPARILQHELDHLEGRLYIDRMISRSFGTVPQVKARFGGKPIAEILRAIEPTPSAAP